MFRFSSGNNLKIWSNFLDQAELYSKKYYVMSDAEYDEWLAIELAPHNAFSHAYSEYAQFATEEDLIMFKLKFG